MAIRTALGIVETMGLTTAIEFADAAVKAANVKLFGYEITNGMGWVTVKIIGDVAAVQAAVSAGIAAASRVGRVVGFRVIPRPHYELEKLIDSKATVRAQQPPVSHSDQAEDRAHPTAEMDAEQGRESDQAEPPSAITEDGSRPQEDPPATQEQIPDEVGAQELPPADAQAESEADAGQEQTPVSEATVAVPEAVPEKQVTCNICGDPDCPRVKGEPRTLCIHHKS